MVSPLQTSFSQTYPKKKAESKDPKIVKKQEDVPSEQQDSLTATSLIHRHGLGIGLGQTVLAGDFGDSGKDSITFDAFYTYGASASFDFFANIHYSSHSKGAEEISLLGTSLAIKARAYQFDSFSPYILGGMGFYRPSLKKTISGSVVDLEDRWVLGVHLGAGADLQLNDKFSFGILAHYHNPFDVEQNSRKDIEGSYMKILLTTMYFF